MLSLPSTENLQRLGWLPLVLAWLCPAWAAAQDAQKGAPTMLAILQRRVEQDPLHADSWRLLAKLRLQSGDATQAMSLLERALELDPELVAAHFDYGHVLEATGDIAAARTHYATVLKLAPESTYAAQLIEQGWSAANSTPSPPQADLSNSLSGQEPAVTPAGYEIQKFDGSEEFDRQLLLMNSEATKSAARWRAFLEMGALYNSNVSLTPISRQLANVDAAAFQGFLNPELEYLLHPNAETRTGPLTRGYFAVNEGHQSQFDLASFQGGWFAERDYRLFGNETIGRIDYVYGLDLQGAARFGDRHAINTSATSILDSGDILYLYGILSFSNFDDDGIDPTQDSLDGPGLFGGITRFYQTDWLYLHTFRVGADLSSVNSEGADTRYFGGGLNTGATIALNPNWQLEPEMGLGFRSYYDFTGPVSRDEVVIHAAMQLSRQLTERASVSAVFGYDRFASDNENFAAERTEGGLISTWIY